MTFTKSSLTGLVAGAALLASGVAFAAQPSATPSTMPPASSTNAAVQPANQPAAGQNQASSQNNGASMANAQNQANNLPRKTVMALQDALRNDGQKIQADGVWGPQTESALKAYQQQSGLPVTGELDQGTRAKLHLQG